MDVLSALRRNRNLLDKIFAGEKELDSVREELRRETGVYSDSKNEYVIATGHQPVFYYPGLLFKNYFAGKHAEKLDCKAYNFVVDSDQNSVEIPVPCLHNGKYCKEAVSLKKDAETVFAGFEPTREDIEKFFDTIEEKLVTLEKDEIISSFRNWKNEFLSTYDHYEDFVDTLNTKRESFEKQLGLKLTDSRISRLVNTPAYYRFVSYILERIERFQSVYNQSVEKMRKDDYQPVKFIHRENGWYEIPFWLIKENKRYPVHLKKNEAEWHFKSDDSGVSFTIDTSQSNSLPIQLKQKALLYPKATTLTLMIRLFFADLFVHGTGAVEYEKINNEFIKEFFNLESKLVFYAVTGNIYLTLHNQYSGNDKIKKQYEEKQKWLKEAKRNPEDLLDEQTARVYKKKKKQLASSLNQAENQDERKKLHRKMEALNEEMKDILSDSIESVKKELEEMSELIENEHIYFERHFPYFIYPPDQLRASLFEDNLEVGVYS